MNFLKQVFSSRKSWITFLLLNGIFFGIWYFLTDREVMFGNYGTAYTLTDIGLSLSTIIGFSLFLTLFGFRIFSLGKIQTNSSAKGGLIGGIIATIISGSSCCGVSIASYLGLMPVLQFLPFHGLGIKFISVLGLYFGIHQILQQGLSCKKKKQ